MQKFRKKPITVNAVQLSAFNREVVKNLLQADGCDVVPEPMGLLVPTPGGVMTATFGDYIYKNNYNHYFVSKADAFEKDYEAVYE